MEQESRQQKRNFHLAGIIPVESQPKDFKFPWSDALIPIAPDYLAVERAIYECAYAGCETIWLICSRETTPLIRHRLGDWINDPTLNGRTLKDVFAPSTKFKQIPIFYVPIHPRDKQKRTGLAWSIIYGFKRARDISRKFSRWTTPGKYYVAFPHGVFPSHTLKDLRHLFSSPTNVFLSFNNKTAKDGEMLAFTFDANDYANISKAFKEEERLLFRNALWKDGKLVGEMLPREQRYSGRHIPIEVLLKHIKIDESQKQPVKWYYDISSWDKYCTFLAGRERQFIKKPASTIRYHEFNHIAEDVEDDIEVDDNEEEFDSDDET